MEVVTTNRSDTLGRTKQKRYIKSNGKTPKSSTQKTQQRSFLMHKFDELPIFNQSTFSDYRISLKDEGGELHLDIGNERIDFNKNFRNLYNAVCAYCNAHHSICPKIIKSHPFEMIKALYKAAKRCCPENNEIVINYDAVSKEIVFIEYAKSNYPQYTCGFIPVKYIETLDEPFRQFFIEFISLIRVTMAVEFPEDNYDFAFSLGMMDDYYLEEDDEYKDFIERYLNGDIKHLFNEILNSHWQELVIDCMEMSDRITSLINNAPSNELKELLLIAIDGINLMAEESINNYRHDLNQCNLDEFDNVDYYDEIFTVDRLFCICYGDEENDPIVRSVIGIINDTACNYSQEELYDYRVITSDYDTPFFGNDFPDKWFDFLSKYNKARWNYEQTYEIDE